MSDAPPLSEQCPLCQLGHLHRTHATYARLFDETLVQAPNVSAWRCDMCGELFFDPDVVRRIEVLVGESGPPPNDHTSATADDHPRRTDSTSSADDASDASSPLRKL